MAPPGFLSSDPSGVERWPLTQPEQLPVSVDEYGRLLPPGLPADYPGVPYGMGDCRTFLDIPPLASFEDGTTCINPDYNSLHSFLREGVGVDPSGFPDRQVTVITIPAGGQGTLRITTEREENGLGHMLIKDFLILRSPDAVVNLLVDIKTQQGDRVFTNRAVDSTHVFNNSQLSCCLPCPVLLYPNQSLIFDFQNNEAFPVTLQIAGRASRFMPYHDLSLVDSMERCWSNMGTTPFWLTFDTDVTVPGAVAGTPGTLRSQMTVPGGGWFLLQRRMVTVTSTGAATAFDVDVNVTEGRVGRRFMTGPINLGNHWATPTLLVAGFPEGMFVAANACHCPPQPQFIRGNTRLIHDFTNNSPDPATVRLTYSGCMAYLNSCPPERDLDLVRRYGSGDAHALAEAQRKGERVFLSFFEANPLFATEENGECPTPAQPCQPPVQQVAPPPPAAPAPEAGPRIVSVFRPNKRWYGPGSTGALPDQLAFGKDEGGRMYTVVRDPRTNTPLRIASLQETPSWARAYVQEQNKFAGAAGLGAAPRGAGPGEWELI